MSNVVFDEERVLRLNNIEVKKKIPTLPRFVISLHLAKNELQANIVLIVVTLICLGTALFLIIAPHQQNTMITLPDGTKITPAEYFQGVRDKIYQ